MKLVLSPPFCRWGTWSTERLRHLAKVTQWWAVEPGFRAGTQWCQHTSPTPLPRPLSHFRSWLSPQYSSGTTLPHSILLGCKWYLSMSSQTSHHTFFFFKYFHKLNPTFLIFLIFFSIGLAPVKVILLGYIIFATIRPLFLTGKFTFLPQISSETAFKTSSPLAICKYHV